MKMAYGHQIRSDDDDYIKIAENTSRCMARSGAAGATPPDFMPIRALSACSVNMLTTDVHVHQVRHIPAWVPGAWWSKYGRDWRFAMQDLFNIPFDRVKKQMVRHRKTLS